MSPITVLLVDDHPVVRMGIRNLLEKESDIYLVKEEAPEAIVEAMRGVSRGETGWVSRRVAARMSVKCENPSL